MFESCYLWPRLKLELTQLLFLVGSPSHLEIECLREFRAKTFADSRDSSRTGLLAMGFRLPALLQRLNAGCCLKYVPAFEETRRQFECRDLRVLRLSETLRSGVRESNASVSDVTAASLHLVLSFFSHRPKC